MRQRAAIVLALLAALFPALVPALGAVGPAAAAGFANAVNASGTAGASSTRAPLPVLAGASRERVGGQLAAWSAQVAAPRSVPAVEDATDVDPAAAGPELEATSQLREGAVVPAGWHSIDRAALHAGSRGPPCSVRF